MADAITFFIIFACARMMPFIFGLSGGLPCSIERIKNEPPILLRAFSVPKDTKLLFRTKKSFDWRDKLLCLRYLLLHNQATKSIRT